MGSQLSCRFACTESAGEPLPGGRSTHRFFKPTHYLSWTSPPGSPRLTLRSSGTRACASRIDRLARSVKDLQDIAHELKAKGIALKAIEHPVDIGTAAGWEM
jgi:hypothetical protein